MKRLLTPIVFLLAALPAGQVLAESDNSRYAWATVIEAEPVTRTTRRPVEERVCWQEEVYREVPERRSKVPVVLGAVLGGVIGNQFGGGSGRDAMTLAGAAVGGAMVADHQRQQHPRRFYASLEDRCGVNTQWTESRTVIGWDVVYEYQGETYLARVPDEPGERIRIEVAVRPVQ
ncbi:MAG: glycine zipper 2TM domain-containing protein [Xanthomonadales bacterium]|nr:glycine zipper 2TM domain-containing protein [Xanthomonadales bacterium]